MLFKNKLFILSTFNLILFLMIEYANELNVDRILYPEGPNPFGPLIFEYLIHIVPKITLGILIYYVYKLFRKQLSKIQIWILVINILLIVLYINYGRGYMFLEF